MDPNATLRELLEWSEANADDSTAADLFLALDAWIRKGGFLPNRWTQNPKVLSKPLAEKIRSGPERGRRKVENDAKP